MKHKKYYTYRIYLPALLFLLVAGCATSPKDPPPLPVTTLEPSSEPPESLKEIFISQLEGEEKVASQPKKSEKLLSFSLNNANIQETLLALSKESGLNFVVDPDIEGQVTVDLKKVTVEEALDSLLIPLGLEYEIRGNFIRVSKPKMETRIFALNYAITKRKSSGELTISGGVTETGGDSNSSNSSSSSSNSNGEGGEEESKSSIATESETDLWADIQDGLETIIFGVSESSDTVGSRAGGSWSRADEEGKRLVGNPLSGTIMITAYPHQLAKAAQFLETVEGSVQRQVLIQSKIMEITLSDGYEMGIDWGYVTKTNDVSGTLPPWEIPEGVDYPSILQKFNPGLGYFQIGIANEYFNVLIDTMASQGQINMLSSPKLCTLNNQKAMIKVGREEVFFEIGTETQFVDGGSRVIESTEARTITIGVILDVTPQISSDGYITMAIHPSVSELAGEAESRLGDTAPIVDVREVSTIIRVKEGQTIVIAGLIKDKVEERIISIPFLGDIPYVGSLFRHTKQNKQKTELVILLTPSLMIGKKIDALAQQQIESLEDTKRGLHLGARPWEHGTKAEYFR